MKSNWEKFLGYGSLVFIAVLIFAWFVYHKRGHDSSRVVELTQQTSRNPSLSDLLPSAPSTVVPAANNARVESTEMRLARYEEKARKLGKMLNRPAKFYGRFVDQYNKPVEGVVVKCGLSYFDDVVRAGLSPHYRKFERTTNSVGDFSISEDGGLALDLTIQSREGYIFKPNGISVMLSDVSPGEPAPTISTAERPYVFQAYKLGRPETLTKGSIFCALARDGRAYSIDLEKNSIKEGERGSDLIVRVSRLPGRTGQANYDWSVRVDAGYMELLQSSDEFMYHAPVTGYLAFWEFSQKAGDRIYSRGKHSKFYLKAKTGNRYARLELECISSFREEFGIRLKYWMNSTGSTNLEPTAEE